MTETDKQTATVLLVDDHPLVRKGLRALLEGESGITVTGEAADGEQAVEQARQLTPDVIIMDITMPRLNGIEATQRILSELPDTRIIALSIHSEKRFVEEMLHAGSAGYLLKDSVPEELVRAINAVLRGEAFLSEAITGTVIESFRYQDEGDAADDIIEAPLVDEGFKNLLQTKLQRPGVPGDMVPRTNLLAHLNSGRDRPLTLVSAAAGYGKSVLISNWLEQSDWPSAWLSLDRNDSDPRQFLAYFISAIRRTFPEACKSTLSLIKTAELPPLPKIASTLANELNAIDRPVLIVLDDYHLIDVQSPVNELLQWMLERPPITLHLVVITRRDPPLSLVSLRAQGQVNEIRAQDLQFGTDDVRRLLEISVGYAVNEAALKNLQQELEGWVAGLRLVSLAVQQCDDVDEFLFNLHGGLQQTQAYLLHEVLNKLEPVLCDWLLKSAILDHFCAPLCDAVCIPTGNVAPSGYNGVTFIKAICDSNLFAIQLDTSGEWFRYHHLFQSMLKHELSERLTDEQTSQLHIQASDWFESQGMIVEAIEHALEAGMAEKAAEIIERHWRAEMNHDRWYIVRKWLDMLPPGPWQRRQELLLSEAWQTISMQQFNKLPALIEQLEVAREDESDDTLIGRDINFFHALIDYWQGNGEDSFAYLEHSVQQLPEQPGVMDGWVDLYYGLALCMIGQKDRAIKDISDLLNRVGNPVLYRTQLVGALVFSRLLSGELAEARKQAQILQSLAHDNLIANTEAWSDYLLGSIDFHRFELIKAAESFMKADRQRYILEPKPALDTLAGLAITQSLNQQADDAIATQLQLLAFANERNDTESLSIGESCVARLQLLRGELEAAEKWAKTATTTPGPDELFCWLEVPSLTRVRVLLAIGTAESLKEAATQLDLIGQTC
ncbi:MAG: response regulator, partial [Arenicellales bacterium]